MAGSLNYLEATELEGVQTTMDLDRFLEGVAVGITILMLFGC